MRDEVDSCTLTVVTFGLLIGFELYGKGNKARVKDLDA